MHAALHGAVLLDATYIYLSVTKTVAIHVTIFLALISLLLYILK